MGSFVVYLGLGYISAFRIYFEWMDWIRMDFVFVIEVGFRTDFKVGLAADGVANIHSN